MDRSAAEAVQQAIAGHEAAQHKDRDLKIAMAIAAALELHEARMHEPRAGTPAWADLHAN